MKIYYKLERRLGKYAITNLMVYLMVLYFLGFLIQRTAPGLYWRYLCLDARAIARGEIWRFITFLMYPPAQSILSVLIKGFLYYSLGNYLEHRWGTFRFNFYIFMGILGHIIGAMVGYFIFNQIWFLTTEYLYLTIFLAFAATNPDHYIYLYFAIPIKAKWFALVYALGIVYSFIGGNGSIRAAIVFSFLNFLVFFFMTRDYNKINLKQVKRKYDFQSQIKKKPNGNSHHRCAVCGRTELDGVNLEFRYCSKCEGNYEYCQDHLYTHQHVTAGTPDRGQQDN